ncbi:hypothetical protein Tco_0186225 [Tanacetum coccineum]
MGNSISLKDDHDFIHLIAVFSLLQDISAMKGISGDNEVEEQMGRQFFHRFIISASPPNLSGYFKPCDSSSPIEMKKMNGGEAFIFNFGSMTETEERSEEMSLPLYNALVIDVYQQMPTIPGDHVITNTSKWKWDTTFDSSSAVTYSPDDQLHVQNKQHVNQCVTCKDICGLNTRVNNAEFGPIRGVKGIDRVSLMKSKVTSKGDSLRSRWVSRSERDKESDKVLVVAVGEDKLSDLVKDKANVGKDKVKDTDVDEVNDKALDVVKEKRKTELSKDKPKDKAPPVVKSKVLTELPKENAKDKPTMDVVNDKALDVVKEKRKTEVTKDNPKDKASSVVKDKVSEVVRPVVDVVKDKPVVDVVKDKPEVVKPVADVTDKSVVDVVKDNAPEVVKEKQLPKDDTKDKPTVLKGKVLTELPKDKHKADLRKGKPKPKPKDKHNVISEVPVLRSKSKCKPKVKAKASVCVLKSNENVKRKRISLKEDHSKKNVEVKMVKSKMDIEYSDSGLESDEVDIDSSSDVVSDRKAKKRKRKAELKRKRKGGSDFDSLYVDEEKVRCMLKKLKKIKKEDSDEDSGLKSKKKGNKKEKQLTPAEAAHEKYQSCIPVGGISLFSLDTRLIEHDFVRLCADQFYPKSLKDIRVGDIASKLDASARIVIFLKLIVVATFIVALKTMNSLKKELCNTLVHLHSSLSRLCLIKVEVQSLKSNENVCVLKSNENVKRKRILSKEDHNKNNVEVKMVKGKMDIEYSDSGLESDEVDIDSSSDVVSACLKKLKKIKKEDSDEDSGLKSKKKGNKKEKQLTPAEAAHEKYLSCFPTMRARTVSNSHFFAIHARLIEHDFVRLWADQFYPKSLKDIRVGDIASKLLYLDSTKFDRFPVIRTRLTIRDWTSTLIRQRQDLETKEHALFKKAKEKLATICSERVFLEDLIRKASSDYPGDGKFVELREKYVQVFRDPISFDVDVSSVDGGNDSDGDDDNDQGNVDEDLNVKDPSGSNSSFGFSKISLDDFEKQPYVSSKGAKNVVDLVEGAKNQVVEKELVDPTVQETGDLFGQNYVRMGVLNQGPLTPGRMPTRASNVKPSPNKRIVKPSSYLLSSYMNKKTKVVPKITRLEFTIGNSLFAMQGDKIVYGIRLNMETLTPSLWIDANVIDCWGAILNHEERFWDVESKCESFSNQVKAQFKGNKGDLALKGIDLKKFFAHHLELYGHNRHARVGRLKPIILKLKWKTKGNFHDCGIFTLLHMESFNGGTAANWNCGLVVESRLQSDMLRRLRFKFTTKILLHEINLHAKNILELAKEFDKVDYIERMSIIIEAVRNREQSDHI